MAYKLAFGSYDFPTTLRPNGGNVDRDLGEQERVRAAGSTVQLARDKSRALTVRGELTADTPDALDTALRALRTACTGQQPLYFGRDDRYYSAQLESWTDDYDDGRLFGLVVLLSLAFRVNDVYAFATAATTATLGVGGGSVTPAGDAPPLPAWSITIGTAGTGTLTLTNATTGETAVLAGTFASGDVIVAARDGYTVKRNGATEFGLLSGRIPSLAVGANTVTLSASGVTISAFSCVYTARYF